MLVMSFQTLGLISMMTVEWPQNMQNLLALCKLFVLDIDTYGFSCIAGEVERKETLFFSPYFSARIFVLRL